MQTIKLNYFKFLLRLGKLPLAAEAVRYARGVALRLAVQETGTLLCACAPLMLRAGLKLQQFGEPAPAPMSPPHAVHPTDDPCSSDLF